jgi:hypothetical protein
MIDPGQSPQHAFTETYCPACGVPESSQQHGADCPRYLDPTAAMHPADLAAIPYPTERGDHPLPPVAVKTPGGKVWHLPHPNDTQRVFAQDVTYCGRDWAKMSERTTPQAARPSSRCQTCWYGRFRNRKWAT